MQTDNTVSSLSWPVDRLPKTFAHFIGEIQEKMPGKDFYHLKIEWEPGEIEPQFLVQIAERRIQHTHSFPHCHVMKNQCSWLPEAWPARVEGLVETVQEEFPGASFFSLRLAVEDGHLTVYREDGQ